NNNELPIINEPSFGYFVQFHAPALGAIFGALSMINGKIFLIALAVVGALLNVLGQKLQH
uniref:hypothetical protein n=1 Tax=Dubosiella newyorkensis TaxID=1862672 RepID=UPI00272AA35C